MGIPAVVVLSNSHCGGGSAGGMSSQALSTEALKPQVSFILGRLKATDCAFSCLGVPEADFNIWQFCIVMAKHVCLIAVMG